MQVNGQTNLAANAKYGDLHIRRGHAGDLRAAARNVNGKQKYSAQIATATQADFCAISPRWHAPPELWSLFRADNCGNLRRVSQRSHSPAPIRL